MDFHLVEPCLFCDGDIVIHHCEVHGNGVSHSIPACEGYILLDGVQIMKLLIDRQHPESIPNKEKN